MNYQRRMSEAILNELAELQMALQWSTGHPLNETAYTTGERIMVNQQRSSLFKALDGNYDGFKQSPALIDKTTRILFLIRRTEWVPLN